MKIRSLYIVPLSLNSGSISISLGFMEFLKAKYKKVAFFKPIIKEERDDDIFTILKHFKLQIESSSCSCFTTQEVESLLAQKKDDLIIETIIKQFETLLENYDFVLIQGLSTQENLFLKNINSNIAKNLSTPLIPILNGYKQNIPTLIEEIKIIVKNLKNENNIHFCTIINKIEEETYNLLNEEIKKEDLEIKTLTLPFLNRIDKLTLNDILSSIESQLTYGKKRFLNRTIESTKIITETSSRFLKELKNNELIITSASRDDIVAFCSLQYLNNSQHKTISILLCNYKKDEELFILNLLKDINFPSICILTTPLNEFEVTTKIKSLNPKLSFKDYTKISLLLENFSKNIDIQTIDSQLFIEQEDILTPAMFEYKLFEKAKKQKQNIVLPESEDERILQACSILINRNITDITLLGSKELIEKKASLMGLDISSITIINPKESELCKIFAEKFYEIRKNKGITKEESLELMQNNPNYFATMMVYLNYASGMVSGATHTTADTVRPALQIIKTKPNIDIVSGMFFMCLDTKVLVFADCAITQNPNTQELSQIAISSYETAKQFQISPKVAMLSYSTGDSGKGEDVNKVIDAVSLTKKTLGENVEGPIQYDAAVDMEVAKKKLPNSKVAGVANVLIFPDLNTGNNTYKAVQRSSGAVAIGPILQGLNKPVNDLSRGCTVKDIINTVAITAIQAQETK